MHSRSTGDLHQALMSASDIDLYIHDNCECFVEQSVTEQLQAIFERKKISKAALARSAKMSEVYLHQVFSGRRSPSRDRLLCLCIGLEATLDETQSLLRLATYAPLYPKLKRDAIILYGLLHHTALDDINDKLFAENEKTLF